MGIVIDTYKSERIYDKHPNAADDFETSASGRLVPLNGEHFERMPLGNLGVLAYLIIGSAYQQNPYTTQNMSWEVGFSQSRVSFFSPDTDLVLGGVARRPGQATMGFYYYNELRSLSLGSAREQGGPYVSMVFVIQVNPYSQIPLGVRVHGTAHNLQAFATLLAARTLEHYGHLSSVLQLDTHELEAFFVTVEGFDYQAGLQTDLFINADKNSLRIVCNQPQLGLQ